MDRQLWAVLLAAGAVFCVLLQGCNHCATCPVVCATSSETCCPQLQMEEKTAKCGDVLKADGTVDETIVRVAGEGLPKQMQGVFWLTGQGDSSSLMSFAKSSDGCGMSPGELQSGTDSYDVRVNGDRVWFFSDKAASWKLIKFIDLVYHFQLTGGTLSDPRSFQIIPQALNIILGISTIPRIDATWLLDFDAHLLLNDNEEFNFKRANWSGSAVWGRPSSVVGQQVKSKTYLLVQVVDGKGKPIQPAFDKWVKFCGSPETGESAGEIHYHEAVSKPANATKEDIEFDAKAKEARKCCKLQKVSQSKTCLQQIVYGIDKDKLTVDCPEDVETSRLFTAAGRSGVGSFATVGGALLGVAAVVASLTFFLVLRARRVAVQETTYSDLEPLQSLE